jgi:hypothetical protein
VVSHEYDVPINLVTPSTLITREEIPLASVALKLMDNVPLTVAPLAGYVILTAGAVVSEELGVSSVHIGDEQT